MTLTQYSKKHNVTRKTAWNHFKRGLIPNAYQLPSGKIILPDEVENSKITIVLFEGTVEDAKRRLGI